MNSTLDRAQKSTAGELEPSARTSQRQGEGTPLKNRTLCAKIRSPFLTPPHPPPGGGVRSPPDASARGRAIFFWGLRTCTENSTGGMFFVLRGRVFQRLLCPHFHFRRRDHTPLCHRICHPTANSLPVPGDQWAFVLDMGSGVKS